MSSSPALTAGDTILGLTVTRSVFVPCRPWTTNEEIRHHWTWRSRLRKDVRETACTLVRALRMPPVTDLPVAVAFQPVVTSRRRQDVGGCVPVAKAALDGLVDAEMLPDDRPGFVDMQVYLPPSRAGSPEEEGLWVALLPLPSGPR